jgi:hypothetical protein
MLVIRSETGEEEPGRSGENGASPQYLVRPGQEEAILEEPLRPRQSLEESVRPVIASSL